MLAKSYLLSDAVGAKVFFQRLMSYWTMLLTVAGLAAGFVFTSTYNVPQFKSLGSYSIEDRETIFGNTIVISFMMSLISCLASLLLCCVYSIAGEENARILTLHVFKMRVSVCELSRGMNGDPPVRMVKIESTLGILGSGVRQHVINVPPVFLAVGLTAMIWAVVASVGGIYPAAVVSNVGYSVMSCAVGFTFLIVGAISYKLYRIVYNGEDVLQDAESEWNANIARNSCVVYGHTLQGNPKLWVLYLKSPEASQSRKSVAWEH